MFYTIYKITNKVNGKYYIGKHQTENLNDGYMGSGKILKRSIYKHGIENFTKEILHIFDNEEEMNLKEKELVVVSEETYNLNEGGHGGFGFINSQKLNNKDKDTKTFEKISRKLSTYRKKICEVNDEERLLMKHLSLKGIETIKERYPEGTWKGRKHKLETIEQMKLSAVGKHVGEKNSQYGTCWITNGTENKKIKKEELDKWTFLGYNKGRI
jgi:GIY-YIG catalytic domain